MERQYSMTVLLAMVEQTTICLSHFFSVVIFLHIGKETSAGLGVFLL